jgi:hypothetical protein
MYAIGHFVCLSSSLHDIRQNKDSEETFVWKRSTRKDQSTPAESSELCVLPYYILISSLTTGRIQYRKEDIYLIPTPKPIVIKSQPSPDRDRGLEPPVVW